LVWYAKDREHCKYRQLYVSRDLTGVGGSGFTNVELADGTVRPLEKEEAAGIKSLPDGARVFRWNPLFAAKPGPNEPVEIKGKLYPSGGASWKISPKSIPRLFEMGRVVAQKSRLVFKRYADDFPAVEINNVWLGLGGAPDKQYVVQTNTEIVQRCLLMTTDPGDLVLDPTCGSGTTAYVAEQWGRRWITTDTSRIAVNIAKSRLMTATFPYYQLYDQQNADLRQGFIYKKVPHITLGSIANNEPPEEETLYDQPTEDKKRLRVAGPFTVETLQSYEPISPEELARQRTEDKELGNFEDLIFAHLKSAGVKTGVKEENAVFVRIDRLANSALHAEGWYPAEDCSGGLRPPSGGEKGSAVTDRRYIEKKAYLHIGPKFGTVSKQAVTEAIKACRDKRDGDWLIILGFSFESGLHDMRKDFGTYQVSLVRMHDDLLQTGLLKKDKKAASFVTIGEPDIKLHKKGDEATVEIAGLDIYDPIKDEVKSRDVHDIAYWMLDDNYDGSNFVTRQVFFCGGDKDEFDDWKKGLSDLAKAGTKKKAEQTLKVQIDDEAFARIYGHKSHPFAVKKGQKVAVRVISQFGEETTKVLDVK
jgi:adenine-specific DNA-methyltransferase